MSLMSSFGEDAYSIRAGLLRRLLERAEDPRYKVVVIEFLTTCVVKQPGLLEMLLSEQVPEVCVMSLRKKIDFIVLTLFYVKRLSC